jgi:hypothetical protein
MGKLLDEVIALYKTVVSHDVKHQGIDKGDNGVVAESKARGDGLRSGSRMGRRNRMVDYKKVSRRKGSFKEWFLSVSETLEDVTGMDMDVFSEAPWGRLFRDGYTSDEAVQEALRLVEEGDEKGEHFSFREWRRLVNSQLRRTGEASIQEMQEAGNLTNSQIHQIFMDSVGIERDAKIISSRGHSRDEEYFDEPKDINRRHETTRKGSFLDRSGLGDDRGARINKLMEELRVKAGTKKKAWTLEDIEHIGDAGAKERLVKKGRETDIVSAVLGIPPRQEPPIDESILALARATGARETGQGASEKAIKDATREANEIPGNNDGDVIEEARVMGGDFGRWGPATSAATKTSSALTKALSKHIGYPLTFQNDGGANSAKGGTILWFPVLAEGDKDGYFLGFQIAGKEENSKWNVLLKMGRGLGSAKTVASKRGVDSGDLASAVVGLKDSLGSSNGVN